MKWGKVILRLIAFCLCLLVCLGINTTPGGTKPLLPICLLQGDGYSSPLQGGYFRVRGLVTLDYDQHWRKGFHLQEPDCDGDPNTSDGLYVYLDEKIDVVSVGDKVQVTGKVHEYYGLTELLVKPEKVKVLSSGNYLPNPLELSPPFDNEAARAYFESHESMLVSLEQGHVVGPTDADERTWVVRSDLGLERVFHTDQVGTGEVICVEDEGPFEITPAARTRDQISGLGGVLTHRAGLYCLELTVEPQLIPFSSTSLSNIDSDKSPQGNEFFSVAIFNLHNLFDTLDDPLTEDSVISETEYQRRLRKRALAIHEELNEPTLISVQEVENLSVLQDLAGQMEIQASYTSLVVDGPDLRGIDVGLLYRDDQVEVLDSQVRQGCTQLVDGLGPDGNLEMEEPQNTVTCDSDGDQILDGNRLFSRPPLIVQVQICPSGFLADRTTCMSGDKATEIWLINVHLKSKLQDTSSAEVTLPRRLEQSQFLADLVSEIRTAETGANLLLLGDLNDYVDSETLAILDGLGLTNLVYHVEPSKRYTYIYHGISQSHDYILTYLRPGLLPLEVNLVHINADYPYVMMKDGDTLHRSSDHDLLWVRIGLTSDIVYLPQVSR